MDLRTAARPKRAESIVPMINVVFLLLIFFLMTSQLSPPEPFEVSLPTAVSDEDGETFPVLYVQADGQIFFEGATSDEAINAVSALDAGKARIQIRADANLKARDLAGILSRLGAAGLSAIDLVVTPR